MAENLFKVFFIISYEQSFSKIIKYTLPNEDGKDILKKIFTKKVKLDEVDDKKEYKISVLSFDINKLKGKNSAIINFTIQNDIYKQQILFKEGRNNFIYNFEIKNNPSIRLLDQSTQLKTFNEVFKDHKKKNKDDILKDLALDSINLLKKSDEINFNFFLDVLKLCYFKNERNEVLLNFDIEKIKYSENLDPKGYISFLSLIEKNPTKFCNENDEREKEKIKEKFFLLLLYFITNYENDEKIKLEKLEKSFSDKSEYLINIISPYTQYYSKIPESYFCDIINKDNLTYETIKRILNFFPLNTKKIEIINLCRDSIREFCKKNDTKLKMIELAPPQKDDNLEQMIYQITILINYQRKNNFLFLLFEQEYWLRYCKYNQTAENLLLINNIIALYQTIDKNLITIDQLNTSSNLTKNKNNNPKLNYRYSLDLKLVQKRLIMPVIGNISVGKSFFLNSLLGIDFCQVKSDIATKFILFIRNIDNLKEPRLYQLNPFKNDISYDFFYNCKEVFTGEENIKNKISEINKENKNSKSPIFYMLEVEIKSIENKEFLNKVDFLDVPGLNESGDDYISLYFDYLKDMIKYCLIIFSVENYNSKDSMEVINKLKKNLYVPIENFLIILNKKDIAEDLEKTIYDLKKVVLNNGSFNIYKNTLLPMNSLMLKFEIQIKNNCKFYDVINYYYMKYIYNKNKEESFLDFIKGIMDVEKKKIQNLNEIKKKISNISNEEMNEIIMDFKRLENENKDKKTIINFNFDKREINIIKLFNIFFKENLLIPKDSKEIKDINNYFNNIKDYNFPNKNFDINNNDNKEYIYDDSDEHKILKDLDKFFEEVFISEKLKNYDNIVPILKDDFKILKNYILSSNIIFIPTLGSSNSGKSKFINCLLEKDILPCDSVECTRRAIIMRYIEKKEKTRLYSIELNSYLNLNDIYYYYTKKELISENLEEIKEIINILNESFPSKKEDLFLLLEINIKFLENKDIDSILKKRDICFIDFPGHNTNNNSFFDEQIYQKVLKMSSFFVYINSGKAFKDNSNAMLLSSLYNDVINIRESDITSKEFIELCLFIFNKVDLLKKEEKDLKGINKEIKETLEIYEDNDDIISCSFFSSKLYIEYLSKIEEYKINKIINLFKTYIEDFKSQDNDDLFDVEESFIKFVEDNLKGKINSDYQFEDNDLNDINKEEITSSDIYKEINTFFEESYKENNFNKEENYNDILQNICKYLIFCNKNKTKLNLYIQSYASGTLEMMKEKIIKSYILKIAEFNNHLERFLSFLNIFFGLEEGFNATAINSLEELVQNSLKNVEVYFEDFKKKKLIEECKSLILEYIEDQKTSFQKLMEKNSNDVNKIIKLVENKINEKLKASKELLFENLKILENNIRDELNKIGAKIMPINKNVAYSISTKEKILLSISYCTLGVGAIVYGLFYKLPTLIINTVSEERKFQQFLNNVEENIINQFQDMSESIENNIKSYKNIITKKLKRLYGIINAGNIKNDEEWAKAKEKYQIIYRKYKSLNK